jgi:hypothetical protein
MKSYVGIIVTALLFAAPMIAAAQENADRDHVEFGIFAEYFRFSDPGPTTNYIGLGGRAAFNVHPNVQLEAEMGYDFERNYTNTFQQWRDYCRCAEPRAHAPRTVRSKISDEWPVPRVLNWQSGIRELHRYRLRSANGLRECGGSGRRSDLFRGLSGRWI